MRYITPRPDQWAIIQHPAKIKTVVMGRRWGKTVLGSYLVGRVFALDGRVAWVTPTYKNSRPLWRMITQFAADDIKYGKVNANKAERTIESKRNGFIGFYSADNIDSIRGEWFHLVVIDEAAFIAEAAWSDAIMPTLGDADGDALLIGTPKGKNWFFHEYLKGKAGADGYASWQAPTMDNPLPNIRQAARRAKDTVSERTYRQEWLAEFLDGGEVFQRIDDARRPCWQDAPVKGHEYVAGLDWAFSIDYTVLTIVDVTTKEVVYIDRFNGTSYELQRQRIISTVAKFGCYSVVAEDNSMGRPNNELLYQAGLPIVHFQTTNRTKSVIIEALATAFDHGEIGIPDSHMVLYGELQAYEGHQLPTSGQVRYGAPEGLHDDCVMSLALAWSAVQESGKLLLW